MGFLKYAIVAAVTVYAIKITTRKRSSDGKSIMDDAGESLSRILGDMTENMQRYKRDYKQTQVLY